MPEIVVGTKRIRILQLPGDAFEAYLAYAQARNQDFLQALRGFKLNIERQVEFCFGEIVCRMPKNSNNSELCLEVHTDIKKHLEQAHHQRTSSRLYETRGPINNDKKDLIEAYFVKLVQQAESRMKTTPKRESVKHTTEPEQRPKDPRSQLGRASLGVNPSEYTPAPRTPPDALASLHTPAPSQGPFSRGHAGAWPQTVASSNDFMSNYTRVHSVTLMRGFNVVKQAWEYIDVPASALPVADPTPPPVSLMSQYLAGTTQVNHPSTSGRITNDTFPPMGSMSQRPSSTTQVNVISDDDSDSSSSDSDPSSDSESSDTESDRGRKRKRKSYKHKKSERVKSRRSSGKYHKRAKSSKSRK